MFYPIRWMFDRLVGAVLRPGSQVEIPLSDELLGQLTVVSTVAQYAADARDKRAERAFMQVADLPPITIAEGLAEQLSEVRKICVRCTCHASEPEMGCVWTLNIRLAGGWDRAYPGSGPSLGNYNDFGHPCRIYDDIFLILPFMCPNYVGHGLFKTVPAVIKDDTIWLPRRGLGAFDMDGFSEHEDGCPRGLEPTWGMQTDGLGSWTNPCRIYKHELLQSPIQCMACRPDRPHGVNRAVFEAPMRPDRNASAGRAIVKFCCMVRVAHMRMGRPRQVQVTAWDSAYCPFEWMYKSGLPMIVIVCKKADYEQCERAGMWPVVIQFAAGDARALGNLRLWAAYSLPVGCVSLCTNAYLRGPWLMDQSVSMVAPVECLGITLKLAGMGVSLIAGGAIRLPQVLPPSRAGPLLYQYALEESALIYSTTPVTRVDHFMGQANILWDYMPQYVRPCPLVLRASTQTKFAISTGVSRYHSLVMYHIVRSWARNTSRNVGWTTAWALPIGEWQDRGPVEVSVVPKFSTSPPGVPATVSAAIASDVRIVNWYVFGSHGDVVPVLALARRLQGWGVPVRVVKVHDDVTGQEILAAVEQGNILSAAPYFVQALTSAATAPGLVFGPPEFPSVAMGVNFRPPSTIIRPAKFGAGILVDFLLESMMRGWAPMFSIGAYRGVHWMPRSADGENFLRTSTKRAGRKGIALMWGSSTLPKPAIDGAVELQPGDHWSQLEKFEVAVCHGGAGSVQTAAAAGCRVVAATSVLDRDYRTKLDAGAGVQTGADPDNIMLALLVHHPKVWIWAWRHSWAMFARAIRWSFHWIVRPASWLILALLVKSFVFVIKLPRVRLTFTTSMAGTVVATVLSHYLGVWNAVWMSPLIEQVISYIMLSVGVTYVGLALQCITLLGRTSQSPITWTFVLFGFGWMSVPLGWLAQTFQLGALISLELMVFVFQRRAAPPSGGYARIGITWAFRGVPLPAFHSRFLNEDGSRKMEGRWVTGTRGLGQLYSLVESENNNPDPTEWTFETTIPWATLVEAPRIVAPYSPLWNCQSAMLYVSRGLWSLMGMSLFVMLPMGLFMLCATTGSIIILGFCVFFIDVFPLLAAGLIMTGGDTLLVQTRIWVHHMLDAFIANPGDWFSGTMAALVGLTSGWGDDSHDRLKELEVIRLLLLAQDHGDMSRLAEHLVHPSPLVMSVFEAKMIALEKRVTLPQGGSRTQLLPRDDNTFSVVVDTTSMHRPPECVPVARQWAMPAWSCINMYDVMFTCAVVYGLIFYG